MTRPSGTMTWFDGWLRLHQVLHPDRRWVDPDSDIGMEFYLGWIDAFDRNSVTYDEAAAASRRFQVYPPKWGQHLAALIQEIRDRRAEALLEKKLTDPDLVRVREESKGCKRCKGSGWVKKPFRLAVKPDLPLWRSFFCSCSLGDFHRSHCPDPAAQYERDLAFWRTQTDEMRPWNTSVDGPLRV
jgi:hypothetical protein